MIFNSIDFLIFLPVVFALYWLIPGKLISLQNILIVIASYVFYGWWDWRFLGLIFFSSMVDFTIGQLLGIQEDQRKRKILLWTSVTINIGLLGFFKYYNFFVESFVSAFTFMGQEFHVDRLNIILPVGISFYTFQTLSYTIDIYKRKLEPTRDIVSFMAFVSFFPQLVAGPIERAVHLLPQFNRQRTFTYENIAKGVKLMIWGFFLKIVVADRVGIYVDTIYNNVSFHEGWSFLAASFFFMFQLYGDFAGYSLIAIGTASMFGFELMQNFNRPFFSHSVGEFWHRWHISLSTWFRDYVYIPLGGNRRGKHRQMANLMITFLVSGLWHGANWTYVIWGALNGLMQIREVLFVKVKRRNILTLLSTFVLVTLTFVFFRAQSVSDALYILKTIVTNPGTLFIGRGADIVAPVYGLLAIFILLVHEMKREHFDTRFTISRHKNEIVRMLYYSGLIILIFYFGVFDNSQFIYFQF